MRILFPNIQCIKLQKKNKQWEKCGKTLQKRLIPFGLGQFLTNTWIRSPKKGWMCVKHWYFCTQHTRAHTHTLLFLLQSNIYKHKFSFLNMLVYNNYFTSYNYIWIFLIKKKLAVFEKKAAFTVHSCNKKEHCHTVCTQNKNTPISHL